MNELFVFLVITALLIIPIAIDEWIDARDIDKHYKTASDLLN